MNMAYLTNTLLTGKWYVSEGFISSRGPKTDDEINKMVRHNIGAHRMVLSGPYETKALAESSASNFVESFIHPYVWQYSAETHENAG